ncbi:hypothetical protein GCM10009611_07770 [Arthrobacter roseus]
MFWIKIVSLLTFAIVANTVRLVLWFAHKNYRRPLEFATGYALIVVAALVADARFVSAVVVVALVALGWKYLGKMSKLRKKRFAYVDAVARVMDSLPLWRDADGKQINVRKLLTVSDTTMTGVYKVDLFTPAGHHDEEVIKVLPVFRSQLGLAESILLADDNPFDGIVSVLFCEVSPLETRLASEDAPVLNLSLRDEYDPYHWLGVGVDANGSSYSLPLFLEEGGSVRQLCAGASGSGKSSIIRQQLVQACLNPNIDVAIFDGKGSEFGIFAPYVSNFGLSTADFWNQIRFMEEEISRRGKALNANKLSQSDRLSQSWNHMNDGNYLLWVWDEIGATMAGFDSKQRHEAMTKIYGILSVARSLGVGAVFSSQTFKSDLLTTQIRDNCFDVSLGFKMNSNQEAAYIGFDVADEITPANIKGKVQKSGKSSTVGTFAMKGIDRNAYGKSYYITDQQIKKALSNLAPLTEIDTLVTHEDIDVLVRVAYNSETEPTTLDKLSKIRNRPDVHRALASSTRLESDTASRLSHSADDVTRSIIRENPSLPEDDRLRLCKEN